MPRGSGFGVVFLQVAVVIGLGALAGCSRPLPVPGGTSCTDIRDCVQGQICSVGTCVAEGVTGCITDLDCSVDGSQLCNAGICVTAGANTNNSSCTSTSECAIDTFCNTATGLCAPLLDNWCRVDDQCRSTSPVCSNKETGSATPGRCLQCLTATDCEAGATCNPAGVCISDGACPANATAIGDGTCRCNIGFVDNGAGGCADTSTGEGEGEGEGEGGVVGATCFRDGACAAGTICRFNNANAVIDDGRCVVPPVGKAAGEICSTGSECARGVCEDNVCSALCVSDRDCPTAMACALTTFAFESSGGGIAEICVIDDDAPAVACADDDVCSASNRLCNDLRGEGDLSLFCGFAGTGAAYGEACAAVGLATREGCTTGLCDGAVAGQCTRGCSTSTQCGSGAVCSGPVYSNIAGGYCADRCVKNSQCDAGRTCQLRNSLDDRRFDTVCAEQAGTLAPGTVTTDARACATALIVGAVCTEMCIVDEDCPAALPRCASATFAQAGRENQTIRACAAPPPPP